MKLAQALLLTKPVFGNSMYRTYYISFKRSNKMKKGLIVTGIAAMAMVMFSANAFADSGGGWGRNHMGGGYHMSEGYHMGGSGYGDSESGRYGRGGRGWGNLSEEDTKKVEKDREAFFKDTQDLRQSIYQTRLEMRAEMAKKDPDTNKLADLQKGLSGFEADFAQKRLNHRLEMKKLLPDNYQAGAGMGRGRGYGRGPGSGGGCW
jgi:Spy/CpxP family protein refolding chaperone